jgi:hypothetical protein
MRLPPCTALLPVVALLAACKADETVTFDAEYTVDVVNALTDDGDLDTNCIDAGQAVNDTYTYGLVFESADVAIYIDGETFASGTRTGCQLNYQSAVWLEDERPGGLVRWQITGTATYETGAGSCGLGEDIQWEGTETIEVVESEDPDVPAGCTYELLTEGTFNGG